jgi:hypothetical protein
MISDFVSLSDKLRREQRTLVTEEGAFDALLIVRPVFSKSPNKDGISGIGAEDNLVAGADEKAVLWPPVPARIVPSEEPQARPVSVLGEIPVGHIRTTLAQLAQTKLSPPIHV